jgi:flagellar hook assembly protein FlgD/outer membrane protein OmpA-like peptidoglycan-associated protein
LWKGIIKTAGGKAVKDFLWKNSPPESFHWDGKDNQKQLVPDGVYFYYIESVDRAGNKTEAELSNIILSTESTPISLSVDASYFAPGIPGSREEVTFIPDIPVKTGIVEWTFQISDQNGRAVKTLKGESKIPEMFTYKGELNGSYIPEGSYTGHIEVEYRNGNNPSAQSPAVTADKSAPSASVKSSLKIFSPNGDGNKDEVVIYQETSKEDVWYGEITDDSGKSIRKFKWVNNADASFKWEGYTDEGLLAPDGKYSYRLYTEDKAGNRGGSESVGFSLDTEETPVILTTNFNAFSPNGNGTRDELTLNPVLNVTEGVKTYKVSIFDSNNRVVKTIDGQGSIRKSFSWDGFSNEGKKVPDGKYYAELEVEYMKGDISVASTREIILDTVYPEINIGTEYKLFSPDNDGRKDLLTINQSSSREKLFTGKIINEDGDTVRQFSWNDKLQNLEWDGRDENGNISGNGVYSYVVSSEDDAGNSTEKTIPGIEIDNRRTTVFVTAESTGFAPNGNGKNDEIVFSTLTTLKEGVKDWAFNILLDGTNTAKSFTGTTLPEKIIWDGRSDSGKVIEGTYKAEYIVNYNKGNRPAAVTNSFILDVSAPDIEMSVSPKPFSPDNDGYDDELTISISVDDQSKIDSWSLDIRDRGKNPVKSYGGSGTPTEKIIWDGVGDDGDLVIAAEDYAYRLRVTDELGNVSEELGIIPIDVLVVKEGDKLKIRIANITFAPDSAELRKDDPEIREKNEYVLGRLSEILKKYESYNIMIEGHAVSVFWANPQKARVEEVEELEPLSKARAETVKNYLEQLGISGSRMKTAGIGGKNPIVPHGDLDNRWKNRRVEFILLK